jgi:hypothetical protein
MSESANSESSVLANSLKVAAAVQNKPWEVKLSRHPLLPTEKITYISTSEAVGVLTHYVQIKPAYDAASDTLHGFTVSKWHDEQEDATIVERFIDTQAEAVTVAQNTIDRLTE